MGTYSLGLLVKKPQDRSLKKIKLIPQYQFNKTKQHTLFKLSSGPVQSLGS